MKSGLVPFGLLGINGAKEFKAKSVVFLVADSNEVDGVLGQLHFLIGDITQSDF